MDRVPQRLRMGLELLTGVVYAALSPLEQGLTELAQGRAELRDLRLDVLDLLRHL
jgi:hypothetical protein